MMMGNLHLILRWDVFDMQINPLLLVNLERSSSHRIITL
jgi:hypothetical protein